MLKINVDLVSKLINRQFPKWSNLEIKPVEKEQKWLPFLARHLSIPISEPLAKGDLSENYPYPWSVNKWLDGETLTLENIDDINQFANDLGKFLTELQSIDASVGPLAGKHIN